MITTKVILKTLTRTPFPYLKNVNVYLHVTYALKFRAGLMPIVPLRPSEISLQVSSNIYRIHQVYFTPVRNRPKHITYIYQNFSLCQNESEK